MLGEDFGVVGYACAVGRVILLVWQWREGLGCVDVLEELR